MQNRLRTSLRVSLPIEPMSYKEQIGTNELVTKLRIIRLVESCGYKKCSVARKFSCHRNTVRNIIKDFRKKISLENKRLLVEGADLSLSEISKLLYPLKNKPKKPKGNSRSATRNQEEKIVSIFSDQKVKVGMYRMKTILRRKFTDSNNSLEKSLSKISVGKLRGIYRKNNLQVEKKRSASGKVVRLYDYKALSAFERLHFDTKHILDKSTLPEPIYKFFETNDDIPLYEWNVIDAKSRFRFMAYSYNLNSEFGLRFLAFVVQFIRYTFNNWSTKITIGQDNGAEFCSGSKRKESDWNEILSPLNAEVYSYHAGHDIRKNLIERSHKTDDYEFLIPRGEKMTSKEKFKEEAENYWFYFNFQRSHSGIGMKGKTPYEIIKDSKLTNAKQLMKFPVLILDDSINTLRKCTNILLFKNEVECCKQKYPEKKIDQKTIIDLKEKYIFFPEYAQNVLTYYPNFARASLTVRDFVV